MKNWKIFAAGLVVTLLCMGLCTIIGNWGWSLLGLVLSGVAFLTASAYMIKKKDDDFLLGNFLHYFIGLVVACMLYVVLAAVVLNV